MGLQDRTVEYTIEGDQGNWGHGWEYTAQFSDEINLIRDKRLRLALELADIAQALEFERPRQGGFPGGVLAVKVLSGGCVAPSWDSYNEIRTDFPDDTIDRFKAYLRENH